jgi:hypothetical protein
MLTSTIKRNAFRVLATLAFAAAPAFASMILVNNPSFETLPAGWPGITTSCGGSCIFDVGAISGWNSTVVRGGQLQPVAATGGYINQDGGSPTSAWANDGIFSQTTGAMVGVGTVYTLTVDIGRKLTDTGGYGGYADLLIGGTRYTATGTGPLVGQWSPFTVTYTGLAADVGKSITIELGNQTPGVYQANFDNVQLDEVPEPASFLLIGSALLALKAFRRRRPIA